MVRSSTPANASCVHNYPHAVGVYKRNRPIAPPSVTLQPPTQ